MSSEQPPSEAVESAPEVTSPPSETTTSTHDDSKVSESNIKTVTSETNVEDAAAPKSKEGITEAPTDQMDLGKEEVKAPEAENAEEDPDEAAGKEVPKVVDDSVEAVVTDADEEASTEIEDSAAEAVESAEAESIEASDAEVVADVSESAEVDTEAAKAEVVAEVSEPAEVMSSATTEAEVESEPTEVVSIDDDSDPLASSEAAETKKESVAVEKSPKSVKNAIVLKLISGNTAKPADDGKDVEMVEAEESKPADEEDVTLTEVIEAAEDVDDLVAPNEIDDEDGIEDMILIHDEDMNFDESPAAETNSKPALKRKIDETKIDETNGQQRPTECTFQGSIFQFNLESVLFTFTLGTEDAIGIVGTRSVILPTGVPIPGATNTQDAIGKLLKVGDVIKGKVVVNSGLKTFKYLEEEEGGEKSEEIEIQPEWFASQVNLVASQIVTRKAKDEIGEIQGKIEKKTFTVSAEVAQLEKDIASKGTNNVLKCRAKLVRLRRQAGNWKRGTPSRITSAEVCILDGLLKDRTTIVHLSSLTIWGHKAANADLNYVLKRFDPMSVEVCVSFNQGKVFVTCRVATIGVNSGNPIEVGKDDKHSFPFKQWMKNRNIDFTSFKKWIAGKLPIKLFMPLPSTIIKAEVITLVRDPETYGCLNLNDRPIVGGIIKIVEEGEFSDKIAYFDKEDFFAFGVRTLHTDLSVFIKMGDTIKCQVETIMKVDRKRLAKELKEADQDADLIAPLALIGETQPGKGDLKAIESKEMRDFLVKKSILPSQFDLDRAMQPSADTAVQMIQDPNNTFKPAAVNRVDLTRALMAKGLVLTSLHDPRMEQLLVTYEDMEIAVYFSKIFTHALIKKMQGALKAKLVGRLGAQLPGTLQSQINQINAAETHLKHSKPQTPMNLAEAAKNYRKGHGLIYSTKEAQIEAVKSFEAWQEEREKHKKELDMTKQLIGHGTSDLRKEIEVKRAKVQKRGDGMRDQHHRQSYKSGHSKAHDELRKEHDRQRQSAATYSGSRHLPAPVTALPTPVQATPASVQQHQVYVHQANTSIPPPGLLVNPPVPAVAMRSHQTGAQLADVDTQLNAYPSPVGDVVRQYAGMMQTFNLTPSKKPEFNKNKFKKILPTPVGSVPDIAQKLKQVEDNIKRKADEEKQKLAMASKENKKHLSSQKMKNVFQSYKASFNKKGVGELEKPQLPEPGQQADDKSLSPLELLRQYTTTGNSVTIEDNLMWFGINIAFPKDARTNFKATPKFETDVEFYTLQTLHYFLVNETKDHGQYIRGALADNVSVVRKPDRVNLMAFLTGEKGWVMNLTSDTHKDLNPHLFGESAKTGVSEHDSKRRSRSPPRRSTRSPPRRSTRSPQRRSATRRSRSPPRRPSPNRRTRSPPRRTRSPPRRVISPSRSKSPPRRRSRSPDRRPQRSQSPRRAGATGQASPWAAAVLPAPAGASDTYNPLSPTRSPPRRDVWNQGNIYGDSKVSLPMPASGSQWAGGAQLQQQQQQQQQQHHHDQQQQQQPMRNKFVELDPAYMRMQKEDAYRKQMETLEMVRRQQGDKNQYRQPQPASANAWPSPAHVAQHQSSLPAPTPSAPQQVMGFSSSFSFSDSAGDQSSKGQEQQQPTGFGGSGFGMGQAGGFGFGQQQQQPQQQQQQQPQQQQPQQQQLQRF